MIYYALIEDSNRMEKIVRYGDGIELEIPDGTTLLRDKMTLKEVMDITIEDYTLNSRGDFDVNCYSGEQYLWRLYIEKLVNKGCPEADPKCKYCTQIRQILLHLFDYKYMSLEDLKTIKLDVTDIHDKLYFIVYKDGNKILSLNFENGVIYIVDADRDYIGYGDLARFVKLIKYYILCSNNPIKFYRPEYLSNSTDGYDLRLFTLLKDRVKRNNNVKELIADNPIYKEGNMGRALKNILPKILDKGLIPLYKISGKLDIEVNGTSYDYDTPYFEFSFKIKDNEKIYLEIAYSEETVCIYKLAENIFSKDSLSTAVSIICSYCIFENRVFIENLSDFEKLLVSNSKSCLKRLNYF